MTDFIENQNTSKSKEIDFNVFLQDGVIISLEIKRWRGKNKLEQDELGLQQDASQAYDNFMKKYVTLGFKNLFPKDILEKISSVEVRARKNLKEYSYESPWGRFVPLTAYERWKENNEKMQEEFFKIRDEIVDNYDEIVERVKSDYIPLAGTVYKRENNIPLSKQTEIPKSFINDFLTNILDQIPSPEEIKESFIYEINLSSLPDLITGMDSVMPSTAPTSGVTATSPAISNTERLVEKLPEEALTGSTLDVFEKQEKKKQIQEDINKSVLGKDNEKLESFLSSVLGQIREISIEASKDILTSIDNNDGKLVGRASIRARNLIDKVRAMDFYGDSRLRELMDDLEKLLDEKPKKRSIEKIKEQVEQIKNYSEESLSELNTRIKVKRSFSKRSSKAVSSGVIKGGKKRDYKKSSDKKEFSGISVKEKDQKREYK